MRKIALWVNKSHFKVLKINGSLLNKLVSLCVVLCFSLCVCLFVCAWLHLDNHHRGETLTVGRSEASVP